MTGPKTTINLPELLLRDEVMEVLRISKATFYRYVNSKKLGVIRLSRRGIRIQREDVLAFVEKHHFGPVNNNNDLWQ